MGALSDQLENAAGLNQMIFPDLWQQSAVQALREGKDVVVQAPTGSGKTLIFELWSNHGKTHDKAVYTVPTRALANDKLAEWRAREWDVGIATGDLSENLSAPIIVATLETQKARLIHGDGPDLLVVDEYQMIADEDRGLNYELALAMAPENTQLLLLSGSVGNPQSVVKWLNRLGREAVLVRHDERPVPLDEVNAYALNYQVPSKLKTYWPRFAAKALAEDLGPILIFYPQRRGAESLANELARKLPNDNPLLLSPEQEQLVGPKLAQMLHSRIAYHHSGLSYGARAGVIEPLAKAGQLRVVIATMGLAAGINFSLRSVALAGDSYRRGNREHILTGDEILQMFGRAGRRGIDEIGYALISANQIRLRDAYPCQLARNGMVDWGALLGLMAAAADAGKNPFARAARIQERLFSSKPIFLGIEETLKNPDAPCGLKTDAERARRVRKRVRQLLNSRGEWEPWPKLEDKPLAEIYVQDIPTDAETNLKLSAPTAASPAADSGSSLPPSGPPALRPALCEPGIVEKVGSGQVTPIAGEADDQIYGRAIAIADRLSDDRVLLVKWIRRLTNWNGRQASLEQFRKRVAPLIETGLKSRKTPLVRLDYQQHKIVAIISVAEQTLRVPVDSAGVALWKPLTREIMPEDCNQCALTPICRKLPTTTGVALLWKRLGLIDHDGAPTLRGRMVSFFSQGDGLAIAAALEDNSYPIDELIYHLANLDAGFRFCSDDNRWAGQLAAASQTAYGTQTIPGYLETGVPPGYGFGAEEVAESAHRNPASRHAWVTELLGAGDIDRMIIEWRSLLRRITHAPRLDWPRWTALQELAESVLGETVSPTITKLPALEYHQTRRADHRLHLKRY
ncbi:MAG: DEAD/DEAH box helicase [Verrucomicrobiia bacterium]|jgi:superfamily II DNA/RNA helicase